MTKAQMIENIRKAEYEAWERKERNAYLLCPRISRKAMYDWLCNDPVQHQLCAVWSALDDLCVTFGIETDHLDIFDRYTHKLYTECKQAENN